MQHMKKKILIIIAAAIAAAALAFVIYVNDYYHVINRDSALENTDLVSISKTDRGYFYDGPGEEDALIFYPGAKVEDIAYSALLKEISAGGVDCFLVSMPCNLAFFGINRADDIIEEYGYENVYLAGHSLGGAMAASYAADNSEKLDGLILLAAYSTKDLKDSHLKVLSVYGSEDKVVNMEKIVQGRGMMPDTYEEFVIEGGNHSGFGDYGEQRGDGAGAITPDEQRTQAAEKILEVIKYK